MLSYTRFHVIERFGDMELIHVHGPGVDIWRIEFPQFSFSPGHGLELETRAVWDKLRDCGDNAELRSLLVSMLPFALNPFLFISPD